MDAFWRTTPRLYDLAIKARVQSAKTEHDRRVEQAWLTAMLGRAKKPPRLTDLLSPRKPRAKPMSWQQMYKIAENWAGKPVSAPDAGGAS